MRGVAFIGGEGPDPDFDLGIRTGDVIVAADSGLHAVHARGLRADWIVGDMDSIGDPTALSSYPADRVKTYPAAKDDTDTEIALRLLADLGCGETFIVGGGGGRLDHLLAIAALFDRPSAPDRWVTKNESVWLLDAAKGSEFRTVFTEWGALLSVFPVGFGPWRAMSRGFRWPLDNVGWYRGGFGISNLANGASCGIAAIEGRFLLVTPLGASVSAP